MADSPPPYDDVMPAKLNDSFIPSLSSPIVATAPRTHTQRIKELKEAILKDYRPGETIRVLRKRPKDAPKVTRIGLFGGPGVGKSALINSFLYVTGKMWNNEAPEAFQTQRSTTLSKKAYDITEYLAVCDNRGMVDFGGKNMTEVGHQLGGARKDGGEVITWDRGFFARLVSSLERAHKAKEEYKIHCAVIVVNAECLTMRAADMKELVGIITKMTGEPPIVIMTHKKSASGSPAVDTFKTDLLDLNIQYVFEIENYTRADHAYDDEKHVELLEALNQCTIVADRMMKHAEEQGGCTIL